MPSRDDHLAQTRHNTQFYISFDKLTCSDWAATVLFYTGLHYIDAFLATLNVHPGSHDTREKFVRQIQELRRIANAYFALKNSSRTARYYPTARFSTQHIQKLERVHLGRIRTELQNYLPI